MTELVAAVVAIFVSLLGLAHTIWRSRKDVKQGISEHEQAGQRDTVADRDALINQFQEMLKDEREERERQVANLTARIAHLEGELRDEREYTDELRHHIYTSKPPPPPSRPNTAVRVSA